jgi:hypothetical protein
VNASTFPSKRDRWLTVLLWGTVILMVPAGATALTMRPVAVAALVLALAVGTIALVLSVLYDTRYTFEGEVLRVRSGPFRWAVPLRDIEWVAPSDDPSSAPACSLDRIELKYGLYQTILLSPLDREGFYAKLLASDDQLARDGDRIVRRAPAAA